MRISCPYCQAGSFLTTEEIQAAVAAAKETNSSQHVFKCDKCRRTVKVSIRQLQQQLPKSAT